MASLQGLRENAPVEVMAFDTPNAIDTDSD
jgi:hypothetical protein